MATGVSAARGMRDQEVLARTLWAEARNGGKEGMENVAQVILNRAGNPRWWGNSVRAVCLAPSQFSCWLASDPQNRAMLSVNETDRSYLRAMEVAGRAVAGRLGEDRTAGADHYYAPKGMPGGRPPRWADPAKLTFEAHGHRFYRLELPAPQPPQPATPKSYIGISATAAVGVATQIAEPLAGLDWRVAVALIVVAAAGLLAWRFLLARRERAAAEDVA